MRNPGNLPYRNGPSLSAVTFTSYHGAPGAVGETPVPAGEVGCKVHGADRAGHGGEREWVKVAQNPHFASDAVAAGLPFVGSWPSLDWASFDPREPDLLWSRSFTRRR